jgi:hypothetical protein
MVALVEYQHKTSLQIVIPFNTWCDNIQNFNCFEIGLCIGMPFSPICIHFVLINGLLVKGLFIVVIKRMSLEIQTTFAKKYIATYI